jgi:hypothetical protein
METGSHQMAVFDLRRYLAQFPAICRRKFGQVPDFRGLERDFDPLRRGARALQARDVLKIFDPARTPFGEKYWKTPEQKGLDRALRAPRNLMLAPVPKKREELVVALLDVFHDIGVVSLILRFTHPHAFGIFSAPVMNLLQIQRPKIVDLYLAYCDELREWQNRFDLATVAETEMALWAYQELAWDAMIAGQSPEDLGTFDEDVWIQRRRVGQTVGPFLDKYGPLELANFLVERDPILAAMVAGREYERLLRCAVSRYNLGVDVDKRGWALKAIDRLVPGHLSSADKVLLVRTWDVRGVAVHARGELDSEQVELMIETIKRVCRSWDPEPTRRQRRMKGPPECKRHTGEPM